MHLALRSQQSSKSGIADRWLHHGNSQDGLFCISGIGVDRVVRRTVLMGSSLTQSVWLIPLHSFIPTYNIIYPVFVRQPTPSLVVYSETEGEQSFLWPGDFSIEIYFFKKGGERGRKKKKTTQRWRWKG